MMQQLAARRLPAPQRHPKRVSGHGEQRSARERLAILVGVSLLADDVGGAAATVMTTCLKDPVTHARAQTIEQG
ncbi:hypothetical protein [Methylocaldum sp. RMAD-M]|jgi:hypothetical protein|uniref:hypothetical protein n=1 Tax=Methylocaldum sp. RMAD-M TaxID=2806557 RepID=UPI000A32171B|nr:hypothetical protein [Methylocaldum sp. RMAD-M]MBP1149527.1 hypothetical protein [Methylocaldum sp. RMAD-M]